MKALNPASSELEVDEGAVGPGLEKGQRGERTIEIRLPSPQPAFDERADADMLDDHRQGVEQSEIVEQFRWIGHVSRDEHPLEIGHRMIEIRQLEKDPEHRDAQEDDSHADD